MIGLDIPKNPDALSAEWLSAALRANVVSYD